MLSGFTYPFKTPANFTARERAFDALPRNVERLAYEEADDRLSTIHLDSTYLDMIGNDALIIWGAMRLRGLFF